MHSRQDGHHACGRAKIAQQDHPVGHAAMHAHHVPLQEHLHRQCPPIHVGHVVRWRHRAGRLPVRAASQPPVQCKGRTVPPMRRRILPGQRQLHPPPAAWNHLPHRAAFLRTRQHIQGFERPLRLRLPDAPFASALVVRLSLSNNSSAPPSARLSSAGPSDSRRCDASSSESARPSASSSTR